MQKAALTLFLAIFALAGCLGGGGVSELQGVQVGEYRGEKLSSIGDFRENSINGPQYVNASSYRLRVTGLVDKPMEYTYEEVLGHRAYSKVVQLDCVEGWSVKLLWEGVLVRDLLGEAKAKPGGNTVIFHAYDGYTTSLPLDYVAGRDILLAYGMNNVTLPPERGFPFQLVAEDKWGYKWIKWVTEIEVSDDPAYRGTWEQSGYSNGGDRDKPMFD
jgi:DMSO/TMAO reductase YedYZ molybdopterin-dependent catalytic subunit